MSSESCEPHDVPLSRKPAERVPRPKPEALLCSDELRRFARYAGLHVRQGSSLRDLATSLEPRSPFCPNVRPGTACMKKLRV